MMNNDENSGEMNGQPNKNDSLTLTEADAAFWKRYSLMTAKQQVELQIKHGANLHALEDMAGQWPGDETDEEFEQLLKDMK